MAIIELIKAIELRKKYNRMKLEDFIKEVEEFKGVKIPLRKIEFWKFTGLNNVDLLESIDDLMK